MKTSTSQLIISAAALILSANLPFEAVGQASPPNSNIISYVDHDLSRAQKYVLRVDNKPFYMTNVQIRLEKLRYNWGWDAAARDAIIGQAAADGFNTVSIPIHWFEVEKSKNKFDWNVLDEYLSLINKYNIKMELLWFSQNSGGRTQRLSGKQLRVPGYVLSEPKPGASKTTSDYTIKREQSDYTLDLSDKKLAARDAYVLGKVMERVAQWDKGHDSKHPVIGVQLGNEVTGYDFNGQTFSSAQVIAYLNELGRAVKQSPYSVWTRVNCVWGMENERIEVNESLRSLYGSNIDFVGVDLYKVDHAAMRTTLPYKGRNYRMIMEGEAEVPQAAQYPLAALSGNTAYDYYDMCSPDGHSLYNRNGQSFAPRGAYIADVRTVNKLLNSDVFDIAINANGYGLFVHNWNAGSVTPTTGVEGISFTPAETASQAISIRRSASEIVLMNTRGGTFRFPDSLNINGASIGYFDKNNVWISQGTIPYTQTGITPPAGATVRLTRVAINEPAGERMQAEFASYGLGSFIESRFLGFAGNGYVNMNAKGGVIHFTSVNGGSISGVHTIKLRYANGGNSSHTARLLVNGVAQTVTFPPTGSWELYSYVIIKAPLKSGKENTIRLEATEDGTGLFDEIAVI